MVEKDGIFKTSDTALVAWLDSQGFQRLESDFSNPDSVVFVFPDDTKALREAIILFQTCKAEGNIVAFYTSYRKLIAEIKLYK